MSEFCVFYIIVVYTFMSELCVFYIIVVYTFMSELCVFYIIVVYTFMSDFCALILVRNEVYAYAYELLYFENCPKLVLYFLRR